MDKSIIFPIFICAFMIISVHAGTVTPPYSVKIFERGDPFAPTVLGIAKDSSDRWHVIESNGSIIHKWKENNGEVKIETIENDALITYSTIDLGDGIGLLYKRDHAFYYWTWVNGVSKKVAFQSNIVDPLYFGTSTKYQVVYDGQEILLYLTENPTRFGFDRPFVYTAGIGENLSFSEEIEFFDAGGFFIRDFSVYQNTTYILFESLEENNGTYVQQLRISNGQTDLFQYSENSSIAYSIKDFVVLNETDFAIVREDKLMLIHDGEVVFEKILQSKEKEGQFLDYSTFIDGTFYFVTNFSNESFRLTISIQSWTPQEDEKTYKFNFETDGYLVRIDHIEGQPVFFFELAPSNDDLLVLKDPSILSIVKVAYPFDDFPSFSQSTEETLSTNDKTSLVSVSAIFAGLLCYSFVKKKHS